MCVYYKVEQAPLCDAMMAFAKLMKPRLSVLKGLNYFTISHNGAKNVWKFFMLLQFHKLFICYRVIQGKMTRYQPLFVKVNSVQEACAKYCKSHEKNERKNIRPLVFSFLPIDLAFWCFLFCFFMWFARFQISICEPQSIWSKLLVLSWL